MPSFEPPRDAMEVERMIANPPSHCALLTRVGSLVGLTLDAQVHDVVSTNGTIVHDDIPCPQGHCTPFLDLKAPLSTWTGIIR